MTEAMPNLQQISLGDLGQGRMFEQPVEWEHNWSDGEDPDERRAAITANTNRYDIEVISNFRKLRILRISSRKLNGRFPFLFNSFPLLQKLSISWCGYLKWDLEMLTGMPVLKELVCYGGNCLTGNIRSLRALKDTLEKVTINRCPNVEGNFMDLADFPHLKELDLEDYTTITGDIRDIGENDFPSLEKLVLPESVYGGRGYKFLRISDGTALTRAIHLLKKQRPALKLKYWHARLSADSPDWYERDLTGYDSTVNYPPPPFCIRFIEAGSRVGYRWTTASLGGQNPCEANWLDPEPDRESIDYEGYVEELQAIEAKVNFYRGFHQPPTEEEYHRLVEERRQIYDQLIDDYQLRRT
jgi:hypothetical protein